MKPDDLVQRIYDHAEAGDTDKAVHACLRLARQIGDTFNAVIFLRELYPDQKQLNDAFFEVTKGLKQEAQEFLWKTTQDRWLLERTLPFSLADDDERNVLAMGVGEIARDVEQSEKSIEDLAVPAGMGEFDTAAFTDRHATIKAQIRLRIKACHMILERIRTRCLYYATRIESQLAHAASASDVMASVQSDVHNYYAVRSESAYRRLSKAASLIGSSNAEDHALLLTSIRRAVQAVADYHYPPSQEPVVCSDGQSRILGEGQYLNRLQEFCVSSLSRSTSTGLLRAELDYFAVFLRRLNEAASKGVHADVTPLEARQGLLGIYMFLSNMIAKLESEVPPDEPHAEG
jgi:hypothetical protein